MLYITPMGGGKGERLTVFGNGYYTPDGIGGCDNILVVDLANGHVKALKKLEKCRGLYLYFGNRAAI